MNRFFGFPRSSDLEAVSEQWYCCEIGTEYLANDPINVSGLSDLMDACISTDAPTEVAFGAPESGHAHGNDIDPFAVLSPELRHLIIDQLPRASVANMRLVSRSFGQLPQSYFHRLIMAEKPWVWEVESLWGSRVDWHALWCSLKRADNGLQVAEQNRALQTDANDAERSTASEELSNPQVIEGADMKIQAIRTAGSLPSTGVTVLRGLRSRRRIWEDIEEIIRRFIALTEGR